MIFREARQDDLPEIIKLLANDKLGKQREDFSVPLPEEYLKAFDKIRADQNQELIVLVDEGNEIVGTLQLSFLQYLTYKGGIRAQIEAVRVKEERRGEGLGEKMITWAIERSRTRGAHMVQLTTDKKRPEALKFYEKMGFISTHEGMKLHL